MRLCRKLAPTGRARDLHRLSLSIGNGIESQASRRKNSVGARPAPNVFPSNVFGRRCSMALRSRSRKWEALTALLARRGRQTRTSMGRDIAVHPWRRAERQKSQQNRDCRSAPKSFHLISEVTVVIFDLVGRSRGRLSSSVQSRLFGRPGCSAFGVSVTRFSAQVEGRGG